MLIGWTVKEKTANYSLLDRLGLECRLWKRLRASKLGIIEKGKL
jgi:hypothetical protein